jgi:hypothetical protein
MKRLLLFLFFSLLFSCTSTTTLTKEEKERAVDIGNRAVSKLMGELKRNLGMALKEGGFPKAIEFCAGKAQKLTEKVNEELVLVKVKRVSDKYRNPKDKPDRTCLLYTSPSPRDRQKSRMPSSA